MTREEQFLALYLERRVQDQRDFYVDRLREYRHADRQLVAVTAVVAALSSGVGALAGADIAGREVVVVLAVVLPALYTALAAYGALYRFDEHAKIYGDAARALVALAPPDDPSELADYTARVEEVLRTEQGRWGQLAADGVGTSGARPAGR